MYSNYNSIKCVCLEQGDDYLLSDGYHRVLSNKDDKFDILVAREEWSECVHEHKLDRKRVKSN